MKPFTSRGLPIALISSVLGVVALAIASSLLLRSQSRPAFRSIPQDVSPPSATTEDVVRHVPPTPAPRKNLPATTAVPEKVPEAIPDEPRSSSDIDPWILDQLQSQGETVADYRAQQSAMVTLADYTRSSPTASWNQVMNDQSLPNHVFTTLVLSRAPTPLTDDQKKEANNIVMSFIKDFREFFRDAHAQMLPGQPAQDGKFETLRRATILQIDWWKALDRDFQQLITRYNVTLDRAVGPRKGSEPYLPLVYTNDAH